jgi:flagellar hook-associated protein 2
MGLKADGIISGINTSQLVSQLGQVYGRPQAFLKNQVSRLGQKKSSYTEMNSLLASVKTSLSAINTTANFRSNSVKTSDTAKDYFSVTANGSALPGSYTVGVEQLAKSKMYTITPQSTFTATTDTISADVTFSFKWDDATEAEDAGFDVDADVNTSGSNNGTEVTVSSGSTVQDVATTLNNITGIQSYLLYDGTEYKLVVTSEKSGDDYAFTMQTSDGTDFADATGTALAFASASDANLSVRSSSNAKIKVNGVEIENSTNAFTSTVPGLTINATSANSGTEYDVTVALDTSAIQAKVNTFITNYNKSVDYYNARNTYDSDSGKKGVFFGDASMRNIMTRLNKLITSRYGADGYTTDDSEYLTTATGNDLTLDALSTIGISINTKGKLSLNSTKFNTAVLDYQDDVEALFSNQTGSTSGDALSFSGVFNEEITTITTSYTGTLASVTSSIDEQVKSLNKQITRWDDRIASYEARLLRQFTAMEQAAGQFQSTGSFLTNFFG